MTFREADQLSEAAQSAAPGHSSKGAIPLHFTNDVFAVPFNLNQTTKSKLYTYVYRTGGGNCQPSYSCSSTSCGATTQGQCRHIRAVISTFPPSEWDGIALESAAPPVSYPVGDDESYRTLSTVTVLHGTYSSTSVAKGGQSTEKSIRVTAGEEISEDAEDGLGAVIREGTGAFKLYLSVFSDYYGTAETVRGMMMFIIFSRR